MQERREGHPVTATPLLEHLRRDAEAEAARLVDAARDAALRLDHELGARLTSMRTAALEATRQQVVRETEVRRDVARRRANEVTLSARQRFVNRALEAASVRAPERARDPALAAWLIRNFHAALGCLPPGPAIVRAPAALTSVIRTLARNAGPALEVREDDSLSPGVVAETPDGALRVDATLASVLRSERPGLAIWLLREAATRVDT